MERNWCYLFNNLDGTHVSETEFPARKFEMEISGR